MLTGDKEKMSASNLAPLESAGSLHPSILREYDIRGVAGETLHEADAYAVGRAFASYLSETGTEAPVVAVGRDGRLSSPPLATALIQGLQDAGAKVLDVGLGPTPMLYFAAHHLKADGGIMVTGSHNPPTHNGFKIVAHGHSFYGQSIKELGQRIAVGTFKRGNGSVEARPVQKEYIAALVSAVQTAGHNVKAVWDPGNGAAGEIVEQLCGYLPPQQHTINTVIDGHFPNHHPDPSQPKNMQQLIAKVREHKADVGLAFDGDGDRLGVVDDKGRIVGPDHLLMLFARDVLREQKGTIIADVKTSGLFFDEVTAQGGTPLMWKTGHSHIKTKMKEISSPFGGEASGHIFFADRYFGFDDGIYAALRMINILAHSNESLSSMIDTLPVAYSTPEIRLDCSEERKFVVIDEVRERLEAAGADFSAIDGVRVNQKEGWWLLRASNTQAAIIARCEAAKEADLDILVEALRSQLEQSGVELDLSGGGGH